MLSWWLLKFEFILIALHFFILPPPCLCFDIFFTPFYLVIHLTNILDITDLLFLDFWSPVLFFQVCFILSLSSSYCCLSTCFIVVVCQIGTGYWLGAHLTVVVGRFLSRMATPCGYSSSFAARGCVPRTSAQQSDEEMQGKVRGKGFPALWVHLSPGSTSQHKLFKHF